MQKKSSLTVLKFKGMSSFYQYQNTYVSSQRKNRFKSENFNKNLHFKQDYDQWLTPLLDKTYQLFAPVFSFDEEPETNRTTDRYYFNETNLDKDFDRKTKRLIPSFIMRFIQMLLKIIFFFIKKSVTTTIALTRRIIRFVKQVAERQVVVILEKLLESG